MAGGDSKTKVQDSENTPIAKKGKDKKKKGKDLAVEAIADALKALPQDQQLSTLLSKYAEVIEENRNLQSTCRTLERTATQAQKDKDRVELEHSKAVLTRSRLESLCRELQRQNKVIKDENLIRLKEEEDRRKEVSNQFNSTLSEISHLMEENTQNNTKLRDENQKMASRLQDLVMQHEKREDHVEKILKQREIETQLAEAKLAKLTLEIKDQKEKMLTDRKSLLEELSVLQDKLQEKALTEISLRTQLNSYTEKFEEFQGTLDKSNNVFNGFKKEIDEMSKTIKLLEKETKMWREKCESANVALCQMFNDRSQMEARIETQNKQNTQLQSLCRALQQQIKELRAQLRSQGILESTSPATASAQPDESSSSSQSPSLQEDSNSHLPTVPAGEKATDHFPLASAPAPSTEGEQNSIERSEGVEVDVDSAAGVSSLSIVSNGAKKGSSSDEKNSTDCESNGTVESELDMEAVD